MSFISYSVYPIRVLAILTLVAVLGSWILSPEKSLVWGLVMVMTAFFCFADKVFGLFGKTRDFHKSVTLERSIFLALLMIFITLTIGLVGELNLIGERIEKRTAGAVIGLLLLITGNYLPKSVHPLFENHCNPALAKSLERFNGLVFVLAGFLFMGVWMVLPTGQAQLFSSLIGLGAFAVALGSWGWLALNNKKTTT